MFIKYNLFKNGTLILLKFSSNKELSEKLLPLLVGFYNQKTK